jgi:quercetin dioxygenase-like cupin family protein
MVKKINMARKSWMKFKFLWLSLIIIASADVMAQSPITRKELMTADIGDRVVKKVDMREIQLDPLQKTGYHKHPCPVVGYIVSGTVLIQVEGDSAKTLGAGDVFFEPANKPMAHFDNVSTTEKLKFIAYYLLNNETALIEMLPAKKND